ncbi:MAG: DUF4145 domain-containing protein [Acidovorax sp.]|uniref:DUF4145 domain-containing protein n=1 Tax=Acidovorax sp. TaxID=1872122 RepID=UPI0025BB74FA|nr:DUF4145 domain-containing protein [Acidovorax sp.]MCE1191010.1 DUF4145 domain-containing protein [Acidovorax sp.]
MSTNKTIWSDCRTCCRRTRHEVLSQHVEETDPEGYHEKFTWQIVRCHGCHTFGFARRHDDYEAIEWDHDGEPVHEVSIALYPSVLSEHKPISETYYLPALIQKVYKQTLLALGDQSYVLASIGLRACIEAVCNHLNVSGSNLEKRIDQLFKTGHVSNGDKRRLHAIRFLGNDAAHEIKEPKASDIRIALEIVEHLLSTVFILESKAKSLDTLAENYQDFLMLINISAKSLKTSNAISLSSLLGRRRRLIKQDFDEFEAKLKEDINSGAVNFLKLFQLTTVSGKEVQLYEVDPSKAVDPNCDIPF